MIFHHSGIKLQNENYRLESKFTYERQEQEEKPITKVERKRSSSSKENCYSVFCF